MTGLSIDTLRAWERRYDAVVPGRGDRGRLYTDAHVSRLRRLAELVERGHAIGTIAASSDAELGRLLAGADALTARLPGPPAVASVDPLMRALDRYDLEEIETIFNRHAAVLLPRDLVFAVVLPLLREIGRRWESGALRPSQEHLVSAIVRSALGGLVRAANHPSASAKIVFATPAGERHELGLLSAALLAASVGYGVVYLGPDVPAADIAHAATTTGARLVMISATTPKAVGRSEARKLARLAPGVETWVGGPDAESLLSAAGGGMRRIERLEDVIPTLAHHAR
jgi:DNA-binding transcriptional MerR regulator